MGQDFDSAAGRTKTTEGKHFRLAADVFAELRYSDPEAAFGVTKAMVFPHLKALDAEGRLERILTALDPATDNIDTEFSIPLPFERQKPSLRDLAFPKPKTFAETGDESNQRLARILNGLAELGRKDPIEVMKRPDTGDTVLHLPRDPGEVRDEAWKAKRMAEGTKFKAEARKEFTYSLMVLLYDNGHHPVGMGSRMDSILHRMSDCLTDGYKTGTEMSSLINDVGRVGYLVRDAGRSLPEAARISAEPTVVRKVPAPESHNT